MILTIISQFRFVATHTLKVVPLLIILATPALAEPWRGIVPGRSTKVEVVKLFPECENATKQCELMLPEEDVYITFSLGDMCEEAPAGTVLKLDRDLSSTPISVSSLDLKLKKFKTFDPLSYRKLGYKAYLNNEDGLGIKTVSKQVIQIVHFAARADQKTCLGYYQQPTDFLEGFLEHYAQLYLDCPKTLVNEGDLVNVTARYNRSVATFLAWRTSGGKIVGPDNRRKLTVDTAGLGGQTIEIAIELISAGLLSSFETCKVNVARKQ